MGLTPGAKLGAYEIVSAIGAGGMGEVYRARDTKLGRDVALKVLPDLFAGDPDRLARFQREAQLLASLNHPHIGAIYGLEESAGVRALILELVDGPTLADRIARGRIPRDEAIPIALQICDALEAAHEKGVVHRDLKPANIKVTGNGTVKVLDFGLAKLVTGDAGGAAGTAEAAPYNASMSPTLTVHGTFAGVILGTAAYMSPEQAKGKAADRTSDVWSFGCVLYEMLTARAAFHGDTVSEILAEVLKSEPDWERLPADTPDAVRRLLLRCLQKERRRRLHDIADAALELDEAKSAPHADAHAARNVDGARAFQVSGSRRWERRAWASAVVLLALVAAGAVAWSRRPPPPAPEMRVDITTPPTPEPSSIAISSDGRWLAFVAMFEGRSRLLVRSLDTAASRPLPGTDDSRFPFWSPDSRSIGFFADGRLKRLDLAGGSPQTLANAVAPAGAAWGSDGTILYSPNSSNGPIWRVSAAGGEPHQVTRLQIGEGHRSPQFLPDGRHMIFSVVGPPDRRGVFASAIDTFDSRRLLDVDDARYAPPGYLLFVRQGTLFAQQFDAVRLTLIGNPFTVADQLAYRVNWAVSTSAAGPLIYRTGAAGAGGLRDFVWFNRAGTEIGKINERLNGTNPSLSPDERYVAFQRSLDGNTDIWSLETGPRQMVKRLTSNPTLDALPVWSPDSRKIVFNSSRSGSSGLYVQAADGGGTAELLIAGKDAKAASDWSRDGRFILYRSLDLAGGNADLWAIPMDGSRQPFVVVQSSFDERDGQFSPDSNWIAYQSDESGRPEIYLQPFPSPGGKERISTSGGSQVRWRGDGKELFYLGLDGRLMAVPIRMSGDGHTVDAGVPQPLFMAHIGGTAQGFSRQQYVVSADGQRFLMSNVVDETNSAPIMLILNWKPKP